MSEITWPRQCTTWASDILGGTTYALRKDDTMWRVILIMLVLATSAFAGEQEWVQSEPAPTPEVIVYYLHSHIRCQACRDMESMAAETVDVDFMNEENSGLLALRTIDIQDPGQEHYADEFNVTGPTLVVAEVDSTGQTEHWRNLDRIWELSENPVAYRSYVRQAISVALTGAASPDTLAAKDTP